MHEHTRRQCSALRLAIRAFEGKSFAARVPASLPTAAGLSELIARAPQAHEETLLALTNAPNRLTMRRMRLENDIRKSALFDAQASVRELQCG
jgi:predicted O-linked N-acetylglucosamine transferase (SPINDLY family)